MTVVASNFERAVNDLYQTEAWATDAGLRHVQVKGKTVWEPAAGEHAIADVLRKRGADVITSDIATYGRDHTFIYDFLADQPGHPTADIIFTNPPYGTQNRVAVKFAERALARCPGTVVLLLTAKFDSGSSRTHLLRDNPRFRAKIVLVDRVCLIPGTGKGGTEDHCWFIWGPEPTVLPAPPPVIFYEGKPAR